MHQHEELTARETQFDILGGTLPLKKPQRHVSIRGYRQRVGEAYVEGVKEV